MGVVEFYASTCIHCSGDSRSAGFWRSQANGFVPLYLRHATFALFHLEFDLCGLSAVPKAEREVSHRCFSTSLHSLRQKKSRLSAATFGIHCSQLGSLCLSHPMTQIIKRRLTVLLCATTVIGLFCLVYVRTHPLIFNESFLEHAHCIVGGGLSLESYAREHEGHFPFSTNGYGTALVLLNTGWDESLTGPGYDVRVFERVRRMGGIAPASEFGRVYVQGLCETNDPEIALLFDKLPTPGGDHCHFPRRLFAPLAREVWTIGQGHLVVSETEWPAYSKRQIELLVKAGLPPEQAAMYYSEKPKQ